MADLAFGDSAAYGYDCSDWDFYFVEPASAVSEYLSEGSAVG